MAENSKTIFYKNFQIEISSVLLTYGKWQPVWWIWISDEATKFFNDVQLDTEEVADLYAEKSAKEYIDKELLGLV